MLPLQVSSMGSEERKSCSNNKRLERRWVLQKSHKTDQNYNCLMRFLSQFFWKTAFNLLHLLTNNNHSQPRNFLVFGSSRLSSSAFRASKISSGIYLISSSTCSCFLIIIVTPIGAWAYRKNSTDEKLKNKF